MTLVEHLQELRRRLIVSVVAVTLMAVVAFGIYGSILHVLQEPYCSAFPRHCALYITSPLSGLSLRVKIATYGGIFLASPVVLWNIWRFITPGLEKREKRYAYPFVASSILLFAMGAGVAYMVFPHALRWLTGIGGPTLHTIYSPNSYISLILLLMVVFGITFEFPAVLVALELAGIVKPQQLSAWRRWAIVLITLGAAIFIPSGDPFSMIAMVVPLYVFYELSIVIGRVALRRRSRVASREAAS